jgi:hypothetical protein
MTKVCYVGEPYEVRLTVIRRDVDCHEVYADIKFPGSQIFGAEQQLMSALPALKLAVDNKRCEATK